MIGVSEKWIAAHNEPIIPETFVEITYYVTEPGVQREAKESNDGAMPFSEHGAIVDTASQSPPLYATLEHNIWGLDGNYTLLPDKAPYGDTGFVSDGYSTATMTISWDAPRTHVIPGIVITWSSKYNEYATRFRVSAYNGEALLYTHEYTNDKAITTCEFSLSGYTRIVIEVLEWCLPNHRVRIEQVFIGIANTYTKTDLVRYKHSQRGDILSAELPNSSITFSLNNADGMWNPDNLVGNVKYLAEQQQLNVRYGMMIDDAIEWIDAGTFWISEWETSSNGLEVSFVARDIFEFMAGVYAGPRAGTLYDIAIAALSQAELPELEDGSPRYRISESLKEWQVDFSQDDTGYTLAEVVQLCANAACCVLYQNRQGILMIEPLKEGTSGYAIRKYVSYSHPEFYLTKPLKSVDVNDGMGVAVNGTTGETQTLDNSLITTTTMANRVAEWVRKTLEGRRTLSGDYRADPRMDVFDKIAVESKYGANNAIYITEIEYTYTGAFKGRYVGRITDFESEAWYSGELISGEV